MERMIEMNQYPLNINAKKDADIIPVSIIRNDFLSTLPVLRLRAFSINTQEAI